MNLKSDTTLISGLSQQTSADKIFDNLTDTKARSCTRPPTIKGRPLSLIALDALYYCTGTHQGNWPIMLRQESPTLIDSPSAAVVLTTIAAI